MAYYLAISVKTPAKAIKTWNKRLNDYIFGVGDELKYDTMEAVFNEVVDETPVLTGRARASWKVGGGRFSMQRARIPRQAKGTHMSKPRFDAPKKLRFNQDYHLINDVPYMNRLNTGHAKDKQPYWIESAVKTALARIDGVTYDGEI